MSQYFLKCLECADTLKLGEKQELDFHPANWLKDGALLLQDKGALISPGSFLMLHCGHALMFTTKE